MHIPKTDRYLIKKTTGKESLTSLSVKAAQKALQMAEVEPDDVDLILFCSSTPDDLFGGAPEVAKIDYNFSFGKGDTLL